jgi:hypothetical protein
MVDSNVEECKVSDQHISTMVLMKDSNMLNLLSSLSFGNPSSDFFFKHDIWNWAGGGRAKALVTRAITGIDDSSTVVHPKDVNFHVSICKFVRLLSRSEQVAFAEIISLSEDVVKDRYCRDKDATVSSNLKDPYLPSQLPKNYTFIDWTYIHGKYALLQCLPYPSVKKVMDHGYVSVKDIVSHLLSFSSKRRCMVTSDLEEWLYSHIHHISESDAVREGLGMAASACGGNDVVVLFCMEWSDNFDTAMSSKQNCRSCWIKTKSVENFKAFPTMHRNYTKERSF